MHLFIIRHGKAHADSPSGTDFDRPLRKRGFRQAFYLADELAERKQRPEVMIASRAVRARDTARTIAESLGIELLEDDRLLVDEPVGPVIDLIAEHAERPSLALAGHNFQISDLIGVLTGQRGLPALRTGECCVLRVKDPADPIGSAKELERLRLAED